MHEDRPRSGLMTFDVPIVFFVLKYSSDNAPWGLRTNNARVGFVQKDTSYYFLRPENGSDQLL